MRSILLALCIFSASQALGADFDWITDLDSAYPTFAKVRVAWKRSATQDVTQYRFRIWSPGAEPAKHNPRWDHYTIQNWVDFQDVPPTSYTYLRAGDYALEVTPVNEKREKVAEPITALLKVRKNAHLPPASWEIDTAYGLRPQLSYTSNSAITGNLYKFEGLSHSLNLNLLYWFEGDGGRDLGLSFGLGAETLGIESQKALGPGSPSATVIFPNAKVDLVWRNYLSERENGWTSTLYAGLGIQEYPETELVGASPEAIAIGRPLAPDIRMGASISKLWASGWQLEAKGQLGIPFLVLKSSAEGATIETLVVNPRVELRALKNIGRDFGWSLGFLYDSRKLSYNVPLRQTTSEISLSGYAILLGAHWNLY